MSEEKKLPMGMQMMLNAVIKALGIDPVALLKNAEDAKAKAFLEVAKLDQRIANIEGMVNENSKILNRILGQLDPNFQFTENKQPTDIQNLGDVRKRNVECGERFTD